MTALRSASIAAAMAFALSQISGCASIAAYKAAPTPHIAAYKAAPTPTVTSTPTTTKAVVGAIRWDAWVGDTFNRTIGPNSAPGKIVDQTLRPSKWHYRLPFYAQVKGTNSVIVSGGTQAIMDQEIQYAHAAGLSYWAFDYYPDDGSGLSLARELYMSSSVKSLIHYTLILNVNPNPDILTLVGMFTNPSFQTVLNGRPLLYLFSATGMDTYLPALRQAATAAGFKDPYVVLMGDPSTAATIGADAASGYVTQGFNGEPYSNLAARDFAYWKKYAGQGTQVVPWVTTGWDPRPRVETRTPWLSYDPNGWAQEATPQEIANHTQGALNWISANPSISSANAVIIVSVSSAAGVDVVDGRA